MRGIFQLSRILWTDARNAETIALSFRNVANNPLALASGVEKTLESVLQLLSTVDNIWLLVFDNTDNGPDAITNFIRRDSRGDTLMTSPTHGSPQIHLHDSRPFSSIWTLMVCVHPQ